MESVVVTANVMHRRWSPSPYDTGITSGGRTKWRRWIFLVSIRPAAGIERIRHRISVFETTPPVLTELGKWKSWDHDCDRETVHYLMFNDGFKVTDQSKRERSRKCFKTASRDHENPLWKKGGAPIVKIWCPLSSGATTASSCFMTCTPSRKTFWQRTGQDHYSPSELAAGRYVQADVDQRGVLLKLKRCFIFQLDLSPEKAMIQESDASFCIIYYFGICICTQSFQCRRAQRYHRTISARGVLFKSFMSHEGRVAPGWNI